MKYKGAAVPDSSPAMGIRRMDRGRHRGKWRAFVVYSRSRVFYSEPLETRQEAEQELDRVLVNEGPARVYI